MKKNINHERTRTNTNEKKEIDHELHILTLHPLFDFAVTLLFILKNIEVRVRVVREVCGRKFLLSVSACLVVVFEFKIVVLLLRPAARCSG
jgi:hypothetical protein